MGIISGILGHASETNAEKANEKMAHILIDGEQILKAFKLVRDEIYFTNCRIVWVDKQGITGSKQEIVSIPFKSVERFSMENAGFLDMDAELTVWVRGSGNPIKWKFSKGTNILAAHQYLASYVLTA